MVITRAPHGLSLAAIEGSSRSCSDWGRAHLFFSVLFASISLPSDGGEFAPELPPNSAERRENPASRGRCSDKPFSAS